MQSEKRLNICFGENSFHLLRASYPTIKSVLNISDDLSIGKISNLNRYLGKTFKLMLNNDDCWEHSFEENYKIFEQEIHNYEEVVLWYSFSPFEFCGMLYVIRRLKTLKTKIYCINISEIKHKFKKSTSSIGCVGELNCSDIEPYMKFKRKLSLKERDFYCELWEELMREDKDLRCFENGKIVSVDINYYDKFIFDYVENNKPKSVNEIVYDSIYNIDLEYDNRISDKIIISRVRKLISDKKIIV